MSVCRKPAGNPAGNRLAFSRKPANGHKDTILPQKGRVTTPTPTRILRCRLLDARGNRCLNPAVTDTLCARHLAEAAQDYRTITETLREAS